MNMVENQLWSKDLYTNNNIFYFFNKPLYEYDMQEAGFNLAKAYSLLPESTVDWLTKLTKERRHIEIGKLYKKDLVFKNTHKETFAKARKMFFEANNLQIEDIVAIKKDAIFTTKECDNTRFLEYINFRPKHQYTSYIRLGRKLELYYNYDILDIKGLSDNAISYHEEYMIKFIKSFFEKMETEERSTVLKYVRRFIDRYKARKLDIGYYRRFDVNSFYDVTSLPGMKLYEYDDVYDVDITFNYFTVLIKLVKIPL
jgi:hypothetical protein